MWIAKGAWQGAVPMSDAEWESIFKQRGAIWIHDSNPNRPHALLTSGLHSDGFVNCSLITQDAVLLQQIVDESLAPKLTDHADWVIGSALGAVTFAYAMALKLKATAGFSEKDADAMKLARFEVKPN